MYLQVMRLYMEDKGYDMSTLLGDVKWSESPRCDSDTLYTIYLENGGRITVLDRETGYGCRIRDIESGYDHKEGFWLASGQCDVREHPELTLTQAVEWIKERANTCKPY